MHQTLSKGLLCILLSRLVISEDPFCGNKCYDSGIATSRNCYCDAACSAIFNDCCGDSEYNVIKSGYNRHRNTVTVCELFPNGRSTHIVKQCSSQWRGPDAIRNSCHQMSNLSVDPVGSVPVTNSATGISYLNYYCAICNGENEVLTFWNIEISCPSLHPNLLLDKDEALNYIIYDQHSNSWGYFLRDNSNNNHSFHNCDLIPQIPSLLTTKVRYCDHMEIGVCSKSWKNDIFQEMCGTYTDPIFVNGTRYKNFYCAICNREDHSDMSCGDAMGPRHESIPDSGLERDKSNFALLLDVNLSSGNNVGTRTITTTCGKGEILDPFVKKCRNIVCGVPGYIISEGKCTMEPT